MCKVTITHNFCGHEQQNTVYCEDSDAHSGTCDNIQRVEEFPSKEDFCFDCALETSAGIANNSRNHQSISTHPFSEGKSGLKKGLPSVASLHIDEEQQIEFCGCGGREEVDPLHKHAINKPIQWNRETGRFVVVREHSLSLDSGGGSGPPDDKSYTASEKRALAHFDWVERNGKGRIGSIQNEVVPSRTEEIEAWIERTEQHRTPKKNSWI
jgi:hypothetical protein